MRKVIVPNDIVLINSEGTPIEGAPLQKFKTFVIDVLLMDKVFAEGGRKVAKIAERIEKAFADAVVGSIVYLEDAHWEMLSKVADAPSGGYNSAYMARKLLPFADAICDAVLVDASEMAKPAFHADKADVA